MHIVKVNGGLGNQMFQYAFALALDELYGDARLDLAGFEAHGAHNGYELDRLFEIRIPDCAEAERHLLGDVSDTILGKARRRLGLSKTSHYGEKAPGFDPEALEREAPAYFAGYWQSYKYYQGREQSVREAFAFRSTLGERNLKLLDELRGRRSIGVHVRRGDALAFPAMAGVCGETYYKAAIAAALEGASNPILVFFSDDLDWCRDRLRGLGEAVYVDWNRGPDSHADMRLMSRCDSLVIANSSFSWWGAWLGEPSRFVAAPYPWFATKHRDNLDIAPLEWIRVPAGGA